MASLISIDNLDRAEAEALLNEARAFVELSERKIKKAPTLRGRTIINMFFEASTRTRSSFELAGKRLSADVINFSASGSSMSKGESVLETTRTFMSMRPDCLVIRHNRSGVPAQMAQTLGVTVVNAGDGTNEHPTQALLDAYTLIDRLGSLQDKTVAIVGDIVRSRVARSDTKLLNLLGANVRWIAPATLLPVAAAQSAIPVFHQLDRGLDGVDAVILLRIQHERSDAGGPYITDTDDYAQRWGLSRSKLDKLAPGALVMHPGPANIGVEINRDLIDDKDSLIGAQVTHGVGVRMAVLYRAIGRPENDERQAET